MLLVRDEGFTKSLRKAEKVCRSQRDDRIEQFRFVELCSGSSSVGSSSNSCMVFVWYFFLRALSEEGTGEERSGISR